MYRPNTLKQRLRNGENVLGCWTMLGSPQVVEILSLALHGLATNAAKYGALSA